MDMTIDASDVGSQFAELASLVANGVDVLIREGDVILQLVPPLPPRPVARGQTDYALESMELVDASDAREWEMLAEWASFRKPVAPTPADDTQPVKER